MNVKIDTKEKFHVITPADNTISEIMTEEISQLLLSCLKKDVKNVILNLKEVDVLPETVAQLILDCQQEFYEQQNSFVICELKPAVEKDLEQKEILEMVLDSAFSELPLDSNFLWPQTTFSGFY